ncbi:hypothetical protein MishRS11D_42050 (plasmid) [Methylomagnum ishizawai]|nr:hypothetical protein MishRS11D_42050 [Methylomagnum ishizawai]
MRTSPISIKRLADETPCYGTLHQPRRQKGRACPRPDRHLRRYGCESRGKRFDDPTRSPPQPHSHRAALSQPKTLLRESRKRTA